MSGDPYGGEKIFIRPECNSILRRIWSEYAMKLYKDPKSIGDDTSVKRTFVELELLGGDIGLDLWMFLKKNANPSEYKDLELLWEKLK